MYFIAGAPGVVLGVFVMTSVREPARNHHGEVSLSYYDIIELDSLALDYLLRTQKTFAFGDTDRRRCNIYICFYVSSSFTCK